MFDKAQLEHAIDMQQRSYRLLKWLADVVSNLEMPFTTAHDTVSFADGAKAFLADQRHHIPVDIRPEPEHVGDFANFFSTYLENSFDFGPTQKMRYYGEYLRCKCELCTWLVEIPHLKTKKLGSGDKKRAHFMRIDALQKLAQELGVSISESAVEALLTTETYYENASLVAYGFDLAERLNGIANGPAVLALWRSFAWNHLGSPKPDFRLTADMILEAEACMTQSLSNLRSQGETDVGSP